eukprot:Nitzschia sp. Nitz4//scaffold271_size25734//12242//13909//NITZ4_008304-RA/size25734-processed-gene-0.8-mRNA-1//-1//CDS//3329545209//1442//frame0
MSPQSSEIVSESSPLLKDVSAENSEQSRWERIRIEVNEQLHTAVPTIQSMVFTQLPWLISLRFVGGIGASQLAAAALATTICNVTGLSIAVGLSSALSTLSGQAKGELVSRMVHERRRRVSFDLAEEGNATEAADTQKDEAANKEPITPVVFFLRGMIIQLCLVIPIAVWWLHGVGNVLLALGQKEELSIMTEAYLQVLAISLMGYSVNWTLATWLQSIGMADVPAVASMIGLALHIPFNWFFIYILDWGYLGCAVATVCFNLIQPTFVSIYLFLTPFGRLRILENSGGQCIGRTRLTFWNEFFIAVGSLRGYLQYLELALPGMVMITEWWASEVAIFLSGRLTPDAEVAVAGMTIYQSINSFCFMFPKAFSIAATTRVSNLLGGGKAAGAQFAADVSVAVTAVMGVGLGILLYLLPHTFFPSLLVYGADSVILETSRTIPLLSIYVFADGIQAALSGVVSGCGRQMITVPIVLIAYWCISVPLAYYVTFVVHDGVMFCDDSYFCGDVGLVSGMTVGTWSHMIMLATVVGWTTNWDMEAKKAKERVAAEKMVSDI